MNRTLKDWLQDAEGVLRWIEPNGYATRAYAGGDPAWMAEPQTAAATLAQANMALGSQVITLDMMPALLGGAEPAGDPEAPLAAAENALEAAAAVERARGVAKAAEHTLGSRVELVLRLPSPSALLRLFGADPAAELPFDDLDDAAMLLANLVRKFSDYGFAGLMLATDTATDEEFEAMDSVLSTIRHYRWLSLLRMDGAVETEAAAGADVDVVLLPDCPPSRFASEGDWRSSGRRVGGGLSAEFWAGEGFGSAQAGALYYGDAPGGTEPETILERVRTLP